MTAAPASSTHHRTVFAVTALGAFMASLDLSIVNVAFPALERAFSHDTRASLSWVLTRTPSSLAPCSSSRGAPRIAGAAAACSSAVSCLLCRIADLRRRAARGGSGRWPRDPGRRRRDAAAGVARAPPRRLPEGARSQVVALWGGIGALAVATGPSLGAALITAFGWRAAFYVNLPVGPARVVDRPARPRARRARGRRARARTSPVCCC